MTPDAETAGSPPDAAGEASAVHRSSRDLEDLRVRLEGWLASQLPAASNVEVPELGTTSATGMSSETLLFQASWDESGQHHWERLVARVAPDPADVPVFPVYRMAEQFETIRLVGELSTVPVPPVRWLELDAGVIGSPFFVMDRVDGEVPPDVMPYPFGDNWLYDAPPGQQRRLQDTTVGVLARLHAIEGAEERFAFLGFDEPGATPLERHVAHARAWYDYSAAGGQRSPLVEQGFDWLRAHWPDESPTVLSWGDSRIGNVLYRDFEPAAVLDWEMAGLGPREVDLGWLIFSHIAFHDMAVGYGLPGMPAFLRSEDVAQAYEAASGHHPVDLDWYVAYAAVQWGIVGLITGLRGIHFGEREMPDDVDDLLYCRSSIERLLGLQRG